MALGQWCTRAGPARVGFCGPWRVTEAGEQARACADLGERVEGGWEAGRPERCLCKNQGKSRWAWVPEGTGSRPPPPQGKKGRPAQPCPPPNLGGWPDRGGHSRGAAVTGQVPARLPRCQTSLPLASSTWTGTCSASTSKAPSTESRCWRRQGLSPRSAAQVRGEASPPLDGRASARGLRGGPSSSQQAKGLSSTWAELCPRAPARPLPTPQCEPLLMSPPGLSPPLLSLALGVAVCKMG